LISQTLNFSNLPITWIKSCSLSSFKYCNLTPNFSNSLIIQTNFHFPWRFKNSGFHCMWCPHQAHKSYYILITQGTLHNFQIKLEFRNNSWFCGGSFVKPARGRGRWGRGIPWSKDQRQQYTQLTLREEERGPWKQGYNFRVEKHNKHARVLAACQAPSLKKCGEFHHSGKQKKLWTKLCFLDFPSK